MAKSPETMIIVNDELAKQIEDLGKRLIEIGMGLRQGFEVPIEYVQKESA